MPDTFDCFFDSFTKLVQETNIVDIMYLDFGKAFKHSISWNIACKINSDRLGKKPCHMNWKLAEEWETVMAGI